MLALAAILCVSLVMTSMHGTYTWHEFHGYLVGAALSVGFFVTIVAGVGVFLEDLKPALHTFWRSRPVNVQLWFWLKFFTGLLITAIALGTPILVAYGLMQFSWWDVDVPMLANSDQVTFIVVSFFALYCWSVAAACLIRQPLYAAVFTLAAYLFVLSTAQLLRDWVSSHGGSMNTFAALFCAVLALFGILAA